MGPLAYKNCLGPIRAERVFPISTVVYVNLHKMGHFNMSGPMKSPPRGLFLPFLLSGFSTGLQKWLISRSESEVGHLRRSGFSGKCW